MSARKVYPPDFEEFVRANCWLRTDVELTAIVNEHYGTSYTRTQIRYYRHNHHCYNGLSSSNYEPKRKYSLELVKFVRENATGRSRKEIIEMVEISQAKSSRHRMRSTWCDMEAAGNERKGIMVLPG